MTIETRWSAGSWLQAKRGPEERTANWMLSVLGALVELGGDDGKLTRSAPRALVELGGDNGELDEELEGDDLEGVLMGGFEDDGAGCSGLLDLQPAGGTDAPAVAGFEAGKS